MNYQESLQAKIRSLAELRAQTGILHQFSEPGQLTKLDYEAIMSNFKLSLRLISLLDFYRECFPDDPDSKLLHGTQMDLEQLTEDTAHKIIENLGLLNRYLN
ncbi:hypothetical protein J4456_02075 [Candidatus Pacearchaeota archaeon]|nr:hypothetical protein [Candidatus Pacearchaeota archaeon]